MYTWSACVTKCEKLWNIANRALSVDNGTVVVNEEDNDDQDMNYALEHIDLVREAEVELVNDAMII